MHFIDSGVASQLLGLQDPDQLKLHPLRGAIFESWVVSEVAKNRLNRGLEPRLLHYREDRGAELDLVVDAAERLVIAGIKSGQTVASEWLSKLLGHAERLAAAGTQREMDLRIVYGGESASIRRGVKLIPWWQIHEHDW